MGGCQLSAMPAGGHPQGRKWPRVFSRQESRPDVELGASAESERIDWQRIWRADKRMDANLQTRMVFSIARRLARRGAVGYDRSFVPSG